MGLIMKGPSIPRVFPPFFLWLVCKFCHPKEVTSIFFLKNDLQFVFPENWIPVVFRKKTCFFFDNSCSVNVKSSNFQDFSSIATTFPSFFLRSGSAATGCATKLEAKECEAKRLQFLQDHIPSALPGSGERNVKNSLCSFKEMHHVFEPKYVLIEL